MAENRMKSPEAVGTGTVDIHVENVSLDLLKDQRRWLLKKDCREADGLINLLDHMIDQAEGFQQQRRKQ